MIRALRGAQTSVQSFARATKERRQYTLEELKSNKWLLPDESCEVRIRRNKT